ncbi:hypothetical protein N9D31_02985, partial [Oligoflexaceae bacterium]|nr:hypothetical protein [Oligoflexaceae bacterium]
KDQSQDEEKDQKEEEAEAEQDQEDNADNEDEAEVAEESKEGPEQTGQKPAADQMSKRDAQRILRGIDDKMAKYMMKPTQRELKEFQQKNTEKDW